MKTVKYLFFCFIATLSFNIFFIRDFIFGVLQILLYIAVLFFSSGALTVYCDISSGLSELYGFLITIGFIITLYGIICLVELLVRLAIKVRNKFKNHRKDAQ